MLVSGALTLTMTYAALAPAAALRSNFGESVHLDGPVAEIVVRNWGALIAIGGGMLVYGAFAPAVRSMVLIVTGLSKIVFITLVLTYGRASLGSGAGVAVVADTVMVLIFAAYLIAGRGSRLRS